MKNTTDRKLKYTEAQVTFSEFPNEISLCLNLSNCPCHCEGCHSPELSEDIGIILDKEKLQELMQTNKGITCVGFMGGDACPEEVNALAEWVKKESLTPVKTGWYSGRQEINKQIHLKNFDYIKIGPYIKALGGLDSRNTNQKFYEVRHSSTLGYYLYDITQKFHLHNSSDK